MLFAYKPPVVRDNWFHTCMRDIVRTVHRLVAAGRPLPAWPGVVPAAHRPLLQNRTALRDRVQAYATALAALGAADQQAMLDALNDQNRIASLLTCASHCSAMSSLPADMESPTVRLFEEAFGLLTDIGTRDSHYARIIDAMRWKICPFCGDEKFSSAGAPREEYDHYLDRQRYPFAGANLWNLVPMGHKCNATYKRTADMLMDGSTRRRAFDPYVPLPVTLSLMNSTPYPHPRQVTPTWVIDFVPNIPEVATWDAVFEIRLRLQRDVLDPSYMEWVTLFAGYCNIYSVSRATKAELTAALDRYIRVKELAGLGGLAFVQKALFEMLRDHCNRNNARLITFLSGLNP